MKLKWMNLSLPLAPGIGSPTENEPWRWFSVLMTVAYDSDVSVPMLVASRTSGSVVFEIDDGSLFATATGGVHSEQNMSRFANPAPSLLRACFTGAAGLGASGVTFAAWSG